MSRLTLKQATAAARNGQSVEFVYRKLDRSYGFRTCWLDDDTLVMSHPTEPVGTVDCPDTRQYQIAGPDIEEQERDYMTHRLELDRSEIGSRR